MCAFFFLSSLLRWHDCVVNKREYLMFQTIYNYICKIELRANNKQGNYFSLLCRREAKKKQHIELHWPGSVAQADLYAYVQWLTSYSSFFFAITLHNRVEITESKRNKKNTHTQIHRAKKTERERKQCNAHSTQQFKMEMK